MTAYRKSDYLAKPDVWGDERGAFAPQDVSAETVKPGDLFVFASDHGHAYKVNSVDQCPREEGPDMLRFNCTGGATAGAYVGDMVRVLRPGWRGERLEGLDHLGDCVERGPDYMGYVVRVRPGQWFAYGYSQRKTAHAWLAARDSKEAAREVLETWAGMRPVGYLCEVAPREGEAHCQGQGVAVRYYASDPRDRLIVCRAHAHVLWNWSMLYAPDYAAKHGLVQDEPIIGGRKV